MSVLACYLTLLIFCLLSPHDGQSGVLSSLGLRGLAVEMDKHQLPLNSGEFNVKGKTLTILPVITMSTITTEGKKWGYYCSKVHLRRMFMVDRKEKTDRSVWMNLDWTWPSNCTESWDEGAKWTKRCRSKANQKPRARRPRDHLTKWLRLYRLRCWGKGNRNPSHRREKFRVGTGWAVLLGVTSTEETLHNLIVCVCVFEY